MSNNRYTLVRYIRTGHLCRAEHVAHVTTPYWRIWYSPSYAIREVVEDPAFAMYYEVKP